MFGDEEINAPPGDDLLHLLPFALLLLLGSFVCQPYRRLRLLLLSATLVRLSSGGTICCLLLRGFSWISGETKAHQQEPMIC